MTLDRFVDDEPPTLREIVRDETGSVCCPVSREPADYSRGEIRIPTKRLSDDELREALQEDDVETVRGFGYESPLHPVLMPETVDGPRADGFGSKWIGVRADYRVGSRWIPVRRDDLPDVELVDDRGDREDRDVVGDGGSKTQFVMPDRPTRVGHWMQEDCDVYVGRGGSGDVDLLTADEIGQRGWLGNPYPVEQFGREQSVAMFVQAILLKIEQDPDFLKALVNRCRGQTLGCWCHRIGEDGPTCHGDVIRDIVDKYAKPPNPAVVQDGDRE